MGKAQFFLTALILGLFGSKASFAQTPVSTLEMSPAYQSTSATFSKKSWDLSTGFEARSEGKDNGFASVLGARALLEMQFSSWFKIEASPYVRYYSSRVQQRFDDDTYEGRLGLSYGHMTITPVANLEIKAGAISQYHLNNSQLISSFRSFPGAHLEYRTSSVLGFSGGVRAQFVVPTSSSLNTQRQNREELPTFATQSVFLEYAQPSTNVLVQGGRYAWSDMPAKIAFDSTRAGNTPANAGTDPESRFLYQYEGWFGDLEGTYFLDGGLSFGAKFKRFKNTKAPENLSDAQQASVFGSQRFARFGYSVEIGNFFSEGDSTVARYTSSSFGNTNRNGNFVEGKLDLEAFKFSIVAKYAQANVLNDGPSQDDMQNLSLMVESYEFQF